MPKPKVPTINLHNPLTKGLVFDIPIWEGGGSITKDLVFGINGTIAGSSASHWVDTIFGKALTFNGGGAADDIVSFATNSKLDNMVTMSIEAWFNRAAAGEGNLERIFTKASTNKWFLRVDGGGGKMGLAATWTTQSMFADFPIPTNNIWHQVIYTVQDISNIDPRSGMVAYLDSLPQTFSASQTGIGSAPTDDSNVYIGNNQANTRTFNGIIGLCRVWNRVITQNEVKQLYTNPWQIYNRPGFLQPLNSISVVASATRYWRSLMGIGS